MQYCKVLEQESIIDKIRSEIDLEIRIQVKHYTNTDAVIDAVLDVIDVYKCKVCEFRPLCEEHWKHKAESEE